MHLMDMTSRSDSSWRGLRLALAWLTLAATCLAPGQGWAYSSISSQELLALISDHRDVVVVVNFFASWCGPCRKEIPELKTVRKEFREEDVFLVGVSVDKSMDDLDRFARDMGFNYPVYLADASVGSTFRVSGIPKLLVYDLRGRLVYNESGFTQGESLMTLLDHIFEQAQQ